MTIGPPIGPTVTACNINTVNPILLQRVSNFVGNQIPPYRYTLRFGVVKISKIRITYRVPFVRWIHWWTVNSHHKGLVMQKSFLYRGVTVLTGRVPKAQQWAAPVHFRITSAPSAISWSQLPLWDPSKLASTKTFDVPWDFARSISPVWMTSSGQ